jgi:hypothetical protein
MDTGLQASEPRRLSVGGRPERRIGVKLRVLQSRRSSDWVAHPEEVRLGGRPPGGCRPTSNIRRLVARIADQAYASQVNTYVATVSSWGAPARVPTLRSRDGSWDSSILPAAARFELRMS